MNLTQHKYNLTWLTNKFDQGETLKFLFFWGHTKKPDEEVGNFCFSQWYELPFTVDGITYKTAEHWMMANKALLFEDLKIFEKIIAAESPGEAKKLGRLVIGFDDLIWKANRMQIVVMGNIHKFNQNPAFVSYLLQTNNRVLVEASPRDRIWGIGLGKNNANVENPYFWNGQNLLGFALMEARDFLSDFGHFDYVDHQEIFPWKLYPKTDPRDMFWRMGGGEGIVINFAKFYDSLPERDQVILRLSHPEPYSWRNFYD